ncbi:MAG: Malonyl-(acyl-carrier protein) O-methyltransferase [Candidatus Hydrogenedentes bacterium ADurb.Bin179]|nr:MAG: Malonyl-(acyl-carrier protein) O-methyltransferase [Candidatus Hydrogenedentes bacterium ADurb.Bin179]
MEHPDSNSVRIKVQEGYAKIAQQGGSCCGPSKSCCGGGDMDALAVSIGYTPEELAALPGGANMGLSCGNPVALASLNPGEIVVDLGSGGGFDVFIAGRKVGPTGRVIGVDMTPEMVNKARHNMAAYREQSGLDNVEFRLGEIEHLPLADNTADVVISNCVINLSPDKPQVWREIARVLKPGGRVAVSDLALLRPLPENIAAMVEALVGCIAGAVLAVETERMAKDAGFMDIQLKAKDGYMEQMADSMDPLYHKIIENLPPKTTISDFVASLCISARKA